MIPYFIFGPISISVFGLFFSISLITAVYLFWFFSRQENSDDKILDFALVFILSGLIFGRVFYIIFNLREFEGSFLKMFHLLKYPGLFFEWGLFFGFIGSYLYGIINKLIMPKIVWNLIFAFQPALLFSEIGCFLSGCSLGKTTNHFVGLNIDPVLGKKFPASLFEFTLLLFVYIFFLIIKLKLSKSSNFNLGSFLNTDIHLFLSLFYFLIFFFIRFIVGFTIDDRKIGEFFSLSQLTSGIFLLLALGMLLSYINWSQIITKFKTIALFSKKI